MRTFGNVGTYMHVIYAYSTTYIGYGTDSDEIVSYTDGKRKNKAPSKKAKKPSLPINYFQRGMVVFHKKFGRGRVKVLNDTSIAVMFDDIDYMLKVFDKKIVLSERLLLNEVDNKIECNKLN